MSTNTNINIDTNVEKTSCGSCALCCNLLKIEAEPMYGFAEKPWNKWCKHARPGNHKGCCGIYTARPLACVQFQCVWLQSHTREDVPGLPLALKPSKCHALMMGSYEEDMVLFCHVDPKYPLAWRRDPLRTHLINVSNMGVTVVIVVKSVRYLMTKGRPTIKLSEKQVQELAYGLAVKLGPEGEIQIGVPNELKT